MSATTPTAAGTGNAVTIALCMIVKDEASVIGRCVESVRGLIDSWVIVDTGSSDGTPELVRSLLAGVPGSLHRAAWRNFGANRTELLELASGSADYLLVLDADMTLRCDVPLPPLTCDAYLLEHEGELTYWVPRLVRGDLPWYYVGATHEHLACKQPFELARLPHLRVVHHGDGGSRAGKLSRDRDLLTRQLEASPDDARTVFYLAQTYRDLGDTERAASLYARRAHLGGFEEEAFYAAFQHALLAADGDWRRGRELLVDAWQRRPQRIEPLYEIALRARHRDDVKTADWATRMGVGAAMPEDILFVHRYVYDWGMLLERSIACARCGRLAEARLITERLLEQSDLPARARAALESNRSWLRDRTPPPLRQTASFELPLLAQLCRDVDVVPLPPPAAAGGWAPASASLAAGDDALACLLGCANPDGTASEGSRSGLAASRTGGSCDPGAGPTCALGVLLGLDRRLAVTSETVLRPMHRRDPGPEGTAPPEGSGLAGLSLADPRFDTPSLGGSHLIAWKDRWWVLATVWSDSSSESRPRLFAIEDGRLETVATFPPAGQAGGAGEKSRGSSACAPLLVSGELWAVSCWRPFTVVRFDVQRSRFEEVVDVATDSCFSALTAGSQGLAVDDGFLFVVRQLLPIKRGLQHVHRFVTVDRSFRPSGISEPFTLAGKEAERCAGIAIRGDDVVLSVGTSGESRADLVVAPLDAVISVIEPLA